MPTLFEWALPRSIVIIDNGGRLATQARANPILGHDDVDLVVLDPASRFDGDEERPGGTDAQYFLNLSLGDGDPATLHVCVDPSLSSTMAPVDNGQAHSDTSHGAHILTTMPIQTLALDSVDELPGLDWLLLGAGHDNLAIIEHGRQTLADCLVVQVSVPFMATHRGEATFEAIEARLAEFGLVFYRFERFDYASHFQASEHLDKTHASQLRSADVLFVPNEQRREQLSAAASERLAFLLDRGYGAHDISYQLIAQHDDARARNYLVSHGYLSAYEDEPDTFMLTAAYSPAPWAA